MFLVIVIALKMHLVQYFLMSASLQYQENKQIRQRTELSLVRQIQLPYR